MCQDLIVFPLFWFSAKYMHTSFFLFCKMYSVIYIVPSCPITDNNNCTWIVDTAHKHWLPQPQREIIDDWSARPDGGHQSCACVGYWQASVRPRFRDVSQSMARIAYYHPLWFTSDVSHYELVTSTAPLHCLAALVRAGYSHWVTPIVWAG